MPGFISHFYMTWVNARERRYEASLANGSPAHLRGWDIGVRVTPRNTMGSSYGKRYSEQDRIELAMTCGSRGEDEGRATALGRIVATPDGPKWEPADPPKPTRVPVRVKTAGHPMEQYAMPVVAALPVAIHTNNPEPDEYICVVLTSRYPSGEPTFGTVRATRNGADWVTESRAYDMGVLGSNPGPWSQTRAVSEMIRLAGCERPDKAPGWTSAELREVISVAGEIEDHYTGLLHMDGEDVLGSRQHRIMRKAARQRRDSAT